MSKLTTERIAALKNDSDSGYAIIPVYNADLDELLRDYFAAKVMQGMLANPYWNDSSYHTIAENANACADAMLAARKEQEK